MKRKLTIFEYSGFCFCESAGFLIILGIVISLLNNFKSQISDRDLMIISAVVLGIIYIILKIISKFFSEKPLIAMLPISYLVGFYMVQFLMVRDSFSMDIDYSQQLGLLTMFFITVSVIDKMFDFYLEEK
ncbi:hypothetical protein MK423_05785 [Streptococcus oralis]|uniref:hypothetical protein n=1 Tax=Streptococcus oralis TaxID=1303 RepID=UPI0022837677|nr:hypothetical protein [Streptococcus oralis]MCY7092172.1 hypothetical protein [Streptococcus oralis]